MTIDSALFSSNKDDWETPPELFNMLQVEFCFTLDACAHEKNFKLPRFFGLKDYPLKNLWDGRVWLNPPYGETIGLWLDKAIKEVEHNHRCELVVALVPARTDTKWWHTFAMRATQIRFLKGRLKFWHNRIPGPATAPFPSALLVFKQNQLANKGAFVAVPAISFEIFSQ